MAGALVMIGTLVACEGPFDFFFGAKGTNGAGKHAKDNESGIVAFSYRHNGSIGGDSYSYDIERNEEGEYVFTYESLRYRDHGEMKKVVDQDLMDRLTKLYKAERLAEWDGFHKADPSILDGAGFSLDIRFEDGASLTAHGTNAFPERYGAFRSEMNAILNPVAEEALDVVRQATIAKGITGKLDFVMANFVQRGASGRDEYSILLSKEGGREHNFDVAVKSYSGAIWPEGEHRVLRSVNDSYVGMEKIQALVEKYDLIQWYQYDKTADDYENSEWFQINFAFEDGETGFYLDAMGTEHPEQYDAFRAEFLALIKEMTDAVEALPEEEE